MNWQTEYFRLLGDSEITHSKIDQAISLKTNNLPKKLFKYRPPNAFTLQNLEGDSVWLDKPALYNDPFEFAEFVDFDKVISSFSIQHYEPLLIKAQADHNLSSESMDQVRKSKDPITELTTIILKNEGRSTDHIQQFLEDMNPIMKARRQQMIYDKIGFMQEQMKTTSFCESHEQLLMWSHYAAHHKGICIEYDLTRWSKEDLRRRSLYPVRYVTEIYNATQHLINSITKKDFNNLYPMISGASKSKDWEYEKEWRIIINIGGDFKPQNYRMDCQKAVYLGTRIDSTFSDNVIDICKKNNIPIYKAILSDRYYKLQFEQIK
jgi:hypothetical protein